MADVADLRLDLTRPGFYLRPDYFDVLADLREQAPVYRTLDGSWAVTRYDDIRSISRDPDRFVSGRGVLINDPLRSDGSGGLNTFSILHLDPPVHALYRKIVNRQFTPRAVGRLEGTIRRTVTEVLDDVVPDEPVDAVDALASVVPIAVIAELFGVGDADRELFRRWSDAIIASPDQADSAESPPEVGQMAEFLVAHIDSPSTEGNDLLEILKSTELEGRPLNQLEIMGFCMTLLVAGNETTRTLMSGGMEALHRTTGPAGGPGSMTSRCCPPRWRNCSDGSRPSRPSGEQPWSTSNSAVRRSPPADFLVMLYASGNRDEAVFGPTAAQLDVRRPVSPTHVAFGFGEHLCLGAALARLEARVFFEELLSRYPTYELVDQPEYVRSTLVRGAVRMPLVLAP